jgi:GPH family glycoside/pentoside/hexuronide:cation symporter
LSVLFGYINGVNPGPQPGNAFRFLMSVIPLILTMIAWLISNKLRFENKEA